MSPSTCRDRLSLPRGSETVNWEGVSPSPQVVDRIEALLADVSGSASGSDLAVKALVADLAAPAHRVFTGEQTAISNRDRPGSRDGPVNLAADCLTALEQRATATNRAATGLAERRGLLGKRDLALGIERPVDGVPRGTVRFHLAGEKGHDEQ